MTYPNKINNLVDVSASQTLAAGGHAQRHNDSNDALKEIRDFLGSGSAGYVLTASPGASGSVAWAPDSSGVLIDAKGDLLVGYAPDLLGRLPVGTEGYVLTASAGASAGVAWAPDSSGVLVDAKGDLLVGYAADVLNRLAVGGNGTILTASSTASAGIAWATSASPSSHAATHASGGSDPISASSIGAAAATGLSSHEAATVSVHGISDTANLVYAADLTDLVSASIITGKGQLYAGTASGSVSVLPPGTDGYVLTASAGASAGLVWAQSTGGGGGASITTASTAPVSASNGNVWYNTEDGALYIYYTDTDSSQWVQILGGVAATGGTGGTAEFGTHTFFLMGA